MPRSTSTNRAISQNSLSGDRRILIGLSPLDAAEWQKGVPQFLKPAKALLALPSSSAAIETPNNESKVFAAIRGQVEFLKTTPRRQMYDRRSHWAWIVVVKAEEACLSVEAGVSR